MAGPSLPDGRASSGPLYSKIWLASQGAKSGKMETAHPGSNICSVHHLTSTKVPAGCNNPGRQLWTTRGWAWMSSSHHQAQNPTWPGVGKDKDYPFKSQTRARSYESKMTFLDTPVLCECVMHTSSGLDRSFIPCTPDSE